MLTAKQISDVVTLLHEIDKASAQQWDDPKFVGRIRAEAFLFGMPLRMELATVNVDLKKEESS